MEESKRRFVVPCFYALLTFYVLELILLSKCSNNSTSKHCQKLAIAYMRMFSILQPVASLRPVCSFRIAYMRLAVVLCWPSCPQQIPNHMLLCHCNVDNTAQQVMTNTHTICLGKASTAQPWHSQSGYDVKQHPASLMVSDLDRACMQMTDPYCYYCAVYGTVVVHVIHAPCKLDATVHIIVALSWAKLAFTA